MNGLGNREIALEIEISMDFMPVLLAVVEKGAAACGMEKRELDQMVLGAEEIFGYLCSLAMPREKLQAVLTDGAYYVQLTLMMAESEVPWEAFNLSAPAVQGDESDIGELGLMLAARFLDGLEVERRPPAGIMLKLIKDKIYPAVKGPFSNPLRLDEPYAIKEAAPADIKQLCALVQSVNGEDVIPPFCRTPGRLVDMAASGDYRVIVARDAQEQMAGGLIWHAVSDRLVEFHGPFAVAAGLTAAGLLVEYCLASLARTSAVALYSRNAAPDYPEEYFEPMDAGRIIDANSRPYASRPVFRLLHEDNGASSWISPVLQPFVEDNYHRLNLPRRINMVENLGEKVQAHSAFLSRLDWQGGQAVMRPLQTGRDAREVLEAYVQVLRTNDIDEIQFELDLGQAEHGELGPALLAAGFLPALLLPYGASGDLLVFCHQPDASRS